MNHKKITNHLPLIYAMGHPFCVLMALLCSNFVFHGTKMPGNLYQISFIPFLLIIFLYTLLRQRLFFWLCGESPHDQKAKAFYEANIPAWLGWPLILFLLLPLEGNVVGFIVVPFMALASVVIGSIVLIRSILQIRRLRKTFHVSKKPSQNPFMK